MQTDQPLALVRKPMLEICAKVYIEWNKYLLCCHSTDFPICHSLNLQKDPATNVSDKICAIVTCFFNFSYPNQLLYQVPHNSFSYCKDEALNITGFCGGVLMCSNLTRLGEVSGDNSGHHQFTFPLQSTY